jgi:hypothetical protein
MAWKGTVGASYAGDGAVGCGTTRGGSGAREGRAGIARGGPNSSSIELPTPTVTTPPHTEHRARIPPIGTFAGSTRKTD